MLTRVTRKRPIDPAKDIRHDLKARLPPQLLILKAWYKFWLEYKRGNPDAEELFPQGRLLGRVLYSGGKSTWKTPKVYASIMKLSIDSGTCFLVFLFFVRSSPKKRGIPLSLLHLLLLCRQTASHLRIYFCLPYENIIVFRADDNYQNGISNIEYLNI